MYETVHTNNTRRRLGVYVATCKHWGAMVKYIHTLHGTIDNPIVVHFVNASRENVKNLRILFPATLISIT